MMPHPFLLFLGLIVLGLAVCAILDELDDQRRDAARRNRRRR